MAGPFMRLTPPFDMNVDAFCNYPGRGAGQPAYNGSGLPASQVAQEFVSSFSYFQTPGSSFVARDSLEHAADRPMTGDPYHDRMTMLAREITRNPQMSSMLDGINQGGQQDGLISQGDADHTLAYLQAQEMPFSGPSQRQQSWADHNGDNGGMRHPLMNPPFAQNAGQPSAFTERAALQNSSADYSQYGQGSMSALGPYAKDSNEDFANKVLTRLAPWKTPIHQASSLTTHSVRSRAATIWTADRPRKMKWISPGRCRTVAGYSNSSTKVKQAPWMDVFPGRIWVMRRTRSGP